MKKKQKMNGVNNIVLKRYNKLKLGSEPFFKCNNLSIFLKIS